MHLLFVYLQRVSSSKTSSSSKSTKSSSKTKPKEDKPKKVVKEQTDDKKQDPPEQKANDEEIRSHLKDLWSRSLYGKTVKLPVSASSSTKPTPKETPRSIISEPLVQPTPRSVEGKILLSQRLT
jgi:hypothetical protein